VLKPLLAAIGTTRLKEVTSADVDAPGRRFCFSVRVKLEESPWTAIAMRATATEAAVAPPDRDGPNMFGYQAWRGASRQRNRQD